nr:immunoglobulin light chain junction region [Macaca mulatta]MOY15456.1 immunoglobulin light chain junction region [Macaca mulatta]MOY17206.1 immunoglobulin light chain junction region [Macaca mulatta]MOY17624.1 immunoglobulin light chain junction region [Macaca mulatta]
DYYCQSYDNSGFVLF